MKLTVATSIAALLISAQESAAVQQYPFLDLNHHGGHNHMRTHKKVSRSWVSDGLNELEQSANNVLQSFLPSNLPKLPSNKIASTDSKKSSNNGIKSASYVAGKSHLPLGDALRNTPWYDNSFERDKNGSITSIHFDQATLNAFAAGTPNRQFSFYEDYPMDKAMSLPIPLLGWLNKPSCCSAANQTSNLQSGSSKAVSNATSHAVTNSSSHASSSSSSSSHAISNSTSHAASNSTATSSKSKTPSRNEIAQTISKRGKALDSTYFQFPMYPALDTFYFPLSFTYKSAANGALIAYRQIGFDFWSYPSGTVAYQMSYRSTSSTNVAMPDVATYFIPPNNDNRHTVAYHNHEDGKNLRCANSFSVTTGLNDTVIRVFLEEGYTVFFPDYEGLTTAFTASVRNAHASLDGMRASIQLQDYVHFSNNQFLVYGYSAGSTVTGKVVELIDSYAPEFNKNNAGENEPRIIAAAVGGFSPNITAQSIWINKGPWAGFVLAGSLGVASEYSNYMNALLRSITTTQLWTVPATMEMCADLIVPVFANQDVYSWFEGGQDGFLHDPAIGPILALQGLKLNVPPVPFLIFQSMADESAPPEDALVYADWACQNGVPVELHVNEGFTHLAEEYVYRFQYTLPFFRNVIAGNLPKKCTSRQDALVPN